MPISEMPTRPPSLPGRAGSPSHAAHRHDSRATYPRTRIPTPFRQRVHEVRTVYLPVMTFLALVGVICLMWKHYVSPTTIVASEMKVTGATNLLTDVLGGGR